jgi:DNA-binding Xre family transcriptional regulator
MTRKAIKTNLRRLMKDKGIKVKALSSISGLNFATLLLVLYLPFSSIKLFQAICICKALKINLGQVF